MSCGGFPRERVYWGTKVAGGAPFPALHPGIPPVTETLPPLSLCYSLWKDVLMCGRGCFWE